ncbi:hypothetical protein EOD08_07020 [Mesorhizobium sp. M6A.T.Ca.TU.002.02.2.1]|nr:hypothetical protein EOD08_07020 [Mesorhizobium sp. M6A.T.Ca.TU.002.02.2.1]RWP72510.1 MAG: hypothetical protein EOR09_20945 [Mesorhizobium sp.]
MSRYLSNARSPSSGRFAATFSPAGRRGWHQRRQPPLPSGERSDCPELPFAIRLAIRVRGSSAACVRKKMSEPSFAMRP